MNPHGQIPEFKQRYGVLISIVCLTFLILVGRLYWMQLVQGGDFLRKAEDNFIQETRIPTVRGMIMDRERRPLVSNRPSFNVLITPRFATPAAVDKLIDELTLTPEAAKELRDRLQNISGNKRLSAHLMVRDISRDQLARLEAHKSDLPGVSVSAVAHRSYLHGNLGAHVVGYLSEVTAEEYTQDKGEHYQPGDLVGRFGVEKMYETHLRGTPGLEKVVVDARGRRKVGRELQELLKEEQHIEPKPGHNIILTIDAEVQRLAERAMRNYPSGAAVVMEVNTGRILASVSKPSFDPNLLTARISKEEAQRLASDPYRPLLDKVYRENYYPGSTYKVISAIAGLEDGEIDPNEKVKCVGWHNFGRRNFRCSHVHGKVDMEKSIVESCNVYFYTMSETVGMDLIGKWAHAFGLGAPTGIGLNGEVAGFIPSKDWYARHNQPFRIGFTLNSSIGQGNTKVTPIQIASLYAAIANGGTLYLPQIVERVETTDGQVVQQFSPRIRRKVNVNGQTLDLIRRGLWGVVQNEKGTAYPTRLKDIEVSGKTGTAQVSRRIKGDKTIWLEDHSWFAAYAPSDSPEIALAVLVEHGGRAAKVAAPIAMEIVQNYFKYITPQQKTAKTKDEIPSAGLAANKMGGGLR